MNNEEVLNKLNCIQPGFKVQRFMTFPLPWVNYGTQDYYDYIKEYGFVNHRQIFDNEIVIDVDADVKEDGIAHALMVRNKLIKNENISSFEQHISGGTGEHFHLFFKDLKDKYPDKSMRNRIKYKIIEFLLGKRLLRPTKLKSHICLFNKQLIQIEGTKHRKGGIKVLTFRQKGLNNVTKAMQTYINNFKEKEEERIEKIKYLPRPTSLNCIHFLLGKKINNLLFNDIQDGLYRASFLLAAYYIRQGKNLKEIDEIMHTWYDNIPEEWKKKSRYTMNKAKISYTIRHSNGSAGCIYCRDFFKDIQTEDVCKGCVYNYV